MVKRELFFCIRPPTDGWVGHTWDVNKPITPLKIHRKAVTRRLASPTR
jgi:hypothetical protein